MNDLTPEDRALLELAREAHEPTDRDRTRVRTALLTRLGVGTGLVTTTAATSKAATGVLLTKLLAGVVLVGAVGGAGVVTYREMHPKALSIGLAPARPQEPAPAAPQRSRAGEALVPDTVVDVGAAASASTPTEEKEPLGKQTARAQAPLGAAQRDAQPGAHRGGGRLASPFSAWPADPISSPPLEAGHTKPDESTPVTPPQATPPLTTLEAETRLVRAGVAALHAGNASLALALFDEHAHAFPNGALAEERAAERVVALGELHRCDQARASAADFLQVHPHSPLAARVRASCRETPNP